MQDLPPLDAPNIINQIIDNHRLTLETYGEKVTKPQFKAMMEDFNQGIDKLISQVQLQKKLWLDDPNPNHSFGYQWLIELIEDEIKQCRTQIKMLEWRIARLDGKWLENSITDKDIATAKAVPIQNLIPGKRKDRGRRIYITCPFHKNGMEKHPSGVVYTIDNSFHCFSCQTSAPDSIEFVRKREKLGFIESIKYLLAHA
jgi:hypothetical protein